MLNPHPQLVVVGDVAADVRRVLERTAQTTEFRTPEFSPTTLGGFCAIGSLVLHRALRAAGVRSTLEFGYLPTSKGGHCWVSLASAPGPIAVDVTATQFETYSLLKRIPPVLICNEKEFICPCGCNGKLYCGDGEADSRLSGSKVVKDIFTNPDWGSQSPMKHKATVKAMIREVARPYMR